MFKKFLVLVLSILAIFTFSKVAFARTYMKIAVAPKPSPTATPVLPVDSFALFWPMVAGKTMQSKIYFLKILKEDIRGFFIFGSAQKADYDIFLSIKRTLEAEALIKGNVPDLANKTIDAARSDLDKANAKLTDAKNSSDIDQTTKDEINTRVNNLKLFVTFLENQYPVYKDKLQSIMEKLNSLRT